MSFSEIETKKNKLDSIWNIVTTLGLMLGIALLVLMGIVSNGSVVHAEDLIDPSLYPYSFSAMWTRSSSDATAQFDSYGESVINSKYPIVGYYQGEGDSKTIYMVAVDYENKEYYPLRSNTSLWYFVRAYYYAIDRETGQHKNPQVDVENVFYKNTYSTNVSIALNENGYYTSFSGALFDSLESMQKYIENGDKSGMIKDDDTPPSRDFGEEYDPDVPIPQLKNLSYNGFTVANAADNLEIDVVVNSWFYGYELKTVGATAGFYLDPDWVIGSVSYDCTLRQDVGFTKSTYNLYEDFGCTNAVDLANYGVRFFNEYPKISDLPTYDFWKYGKVSLAQKYDEIQAQYGATEKDKDAYRVAVPLLETSKQAITKYYVRFYELRPNEGGVGLDMIPGQWYSYTYRYDNNGKAVVVVSPVGGDENGDPIDQAPERGEQDENGDITIGDPPINYSGDSLLEIITGIFGDLTAMIETFQGFSDFLTEAFAFIPETIWTLIRIGVGLSVIFLVWRFVVR